MILISYFPELKEINAMRAPGWVQIYENERLAVHLPKSVAMVGLKKFHTNRWRKLPAKTIWQQVSLPACPLHIRSFREHF